jgi:NAD(P)H-hydrate repair Nnr-like enzyme with NAD(P)H-hydrate dehydratase domain
VQRDRLDAANRLASRFGCVVVLKGSGTVITAPGTLPRINPTGNARLAIAGTGDVLAGMMAARLAAGSDALHAATAAVYAHGALADAWPPDRPLTATALAQAGR